MGCRYGAQEESLCLSSNLSQSLYQYGDPKYKSVRDSGVPIKEIGYPHDMNYVGIYSPGVTFFRNNITKYYTLRDATFKCDVITVVALCFNGKSHYVVLSSFPIRLRMGVLPLEARKSCLTIFAPSSVCVSSTVRMLLFLAHSVVARMRSCLLRLPPYSAS